MTPRAPMALSVGLKSTVSGKGAGLYEGNVLVTAKDGAALTPDAVLSHVAAQLPPYAVPVRVRVMTAFPRTSTGKIDRRELARIL